jgi:hypothetical protein
MANNVSLFFVLLLASLPAFPACQDCSSLENNDDVPQGDGPLADLYTGEGFQNVPFQIPITYVSASFAPIIRSVRVPQDYELILYEQVGNVGTYIVISGRDVPSLEEYYFAARMRSLRFGRRTETTLQHPQIFGGQSYTGEVHFLPFGFTELPELTFFRSLKVPVGMKVTLTTAIGPKSVRSYDFTSDTSEMPFSDPVKSVSVIINLSGEF